MSPSLLSFTSHAFFRAFKSQQGHTKLPDYVPVGQFQKAPLRDLFTAASADCLNLLGKCLLYEPRRRISAGEVGCDNFWNAPSPDSSDFFYHRL